MANDFAELVAAQRERYLGGVTRTAAWRREQLTRMRGLLTDNQVALRAALHEDFRKPPFEQLFEITVPLGVVDYYLDHLDALMAPEEVPLPPGLAAAGNRGVVLREPYGPTLVIGPFNAPILLLLDPALAALAAGKPGRAQACQHHSGDRQVAGRADQRGFRPRRRGGRDGRPGGDLRAPRPPLGLHLLHRQLRRRQGRDEGSC